MLELLRNNKKVAEMLAYICDVNILPQLKEPNNPKGHLTFNIHGQTFACDGLGSEYIIFEDKSVGFCDSEGKCGRIADSLEEFFIFMINCPFWRDYIKKEVYENIEVLHKFAIETFEYHCKILRDEIGINLLAVQKKLAAELKLTLYEDATENLLVKFYKTATRSPKIIAIFNDNNGNKMMIIA